MPGVQTTIKGQFLDSINNEGVSGIKIRIAEYESTNAGIFSERTEFIGNVGEVVTDNNGQYSVTFQTSGNGNKYHFLVDEIPTKYTISEKGKLPYYNSLDKEIKNIGSDIQYDFKVVHTFITKARIIVHNNPASYVTMKLLDTKNALLGFNIVGKANNDTIVHIPVTKKVTSCNLLFYMTIGTSYYGNPDIPLNPVFDKDTIDIGTYNIYPSTFIKQ